MASCLWQYVTIISVPYGMSVALFVALHIIDEEALNKKEASILYSALIQWKYGDARKKSFWTRLCPRLYRQLYIIYWNYLITFSKSQKIVFNNFKRLRHGMRLFHPSVWWKYSLFLRFSPCREPRLRHFAGYPFGALRKKHQPFSITQPSENTAQAMLPFRCPFFFKSLSFSVINPSCRALRVPKTVFFIYPNGLNQEKRI